MIIGVMKEHTPEPCVPPVPETVTAHVKMKVTVWIGRGAIDTVYFNDQSYTAAGAVIKDGTEISSPADMVFSQQTDNIKNVKAGVVQVGIFQPMFTPALMQQRPPGLA